MLELVLITMAAGAAAGALSCLLGIGGGVFLVPFLNLGLGLPMPAASGISLVTVIATSSATSAMPGRIRLVNLRLGMLLEVFTTVGGLFGLFLVQRVAEASLQRAFGWLMAIVAAVMLTRLNRRNIFPADDGDTGMLGGRLIDDETGREVAYRLKRAPLAFFVSFVAGAASMLGIGGGIVKVPALNAWCGIPMRVAAATSSLMIAATAVVGAVTYYLRGDIVPNLAAAAVLGVLAGSHVGQKLGVRTRARELKLLLASVLAVVALLYFVRAGR